ncbi:MAG: ABC transporter permease [Verrucomicrobiota bacterium]
MNLLNLTIRNAKFYWRDHLGLVLGASLATTVLLGALGVGDSVRETLVQIVNARIGKIDYLLFSKDRFFRQELSQDLREKQKGLVASGAMVVGTVATPSGNSRVNQAQIMGMEADFWKFAPELIDWKPEGKKVGINQALANQLSVRPGDTIVLRMERPSLISRDAPISGGRDYLESIRLEVDRVLDAKSFGLFSLNASHLAPYNVFIDQKSLAKTLGFESKANLLLIGDVEKQGVTLWSEALETCFKLQDFALNLKDLNHGQYELSSDRVFIDTPLQNRLLKVNNDSYGVVTYLVNEIKPLEDHKNSLWTPYSMVTAVDPKQVGFLPDDLDNDEVVINQWLADDLDLSIKDKIALRYYVEGERRELIEQETVMNVRAILPMQGPQIDSRWMPDFPGISEEDNCREWDPGVPIDLDKIREKDEVYWDEYKGAPKAYMTLAKGKKIWGSRFGELTAIRYTASKSLRTDLRSKIQGMDLGLMLLPFAEIAHKGGKAPFDFSELFLSFSFFIILASAFLMGLFFAFSLEQRSREVGVYLAVGWSRKKIKQLVITEGLGMSVLGSILGVLLGVAYTVLMLWGLDSIWKGAVGEIDFIFHISAMSIIVGVLLSLGIAWVSMFWVLRKQFASSVRESLAGLTHHEFSVRIKPSGKKFRWSWVMIAGAFLSVFVLMLRGQAASGVIQSGMFFGAGALALAGGILVCSEWFIYLAKGANLKNTFGSLSQLAVRNAARRRSRSLVVVGVLACGVFLLISVGLFRKDATVQSEERSFGTGGYVLWGETTVPLYDDLNRTSVQESLGFAGGVLNGVAFLPFRVKEGDEASCLNLNTAQSPRILGVKSQDLESRKAFSFSSKANNQGKGWALLRDNLGERVIPAIGDLNSLTWSLGLKIGDEINYLDDFGEPFRIRIVAAVTGSLLQGSLIIDEEAFRNIFVDEGGYQAFLIDSDEGHSEKVEEELSRVLGDYGMSVTTTWERLARLYAVENAYISMFQVLGGLGLILGSIGVAVTLLRNVMERKVEFSLMRAVGFSKKNVRYLVVKESFHLMAWGLALGVMASLLAVIPALSANWSFSMLLWLFMMMLVLCLMGILFSWRASSFALQRANVQVLRAE